MKVSDLVVCINDDFTDLILKIGADKFIKDFQQLPVKDKIYTIREIRPEIDGTPSGLVLEEIRNKPVFLPYFQGYAEPGFATSRFRPIDTLINEEQKVNLNKRELILN